MRELEWLGLFQNMPGDNESLYLRSSFANFAKLGVPQIAFDRQIAAVAVTTVNLHRSSFTPRNVVAARSWLRSGTHTIKLVALGTAGHPRIDIDAFLVIR